jgi:hypothetical protein
VSTIATFQNNKKINQWLNQTSFIHFFTYLMNFCSQSGQQLAAGTEKFCPNCGQDLMKGGIRRGEAGSGIVNVIQQELANIQHLEYAKALKDFSENVNRHLKARQLSEEQVISINTSLEELVKEVQGVKPGREEQIDYPIQLNIESKIVSIVQKILNVLPEAEEETASIFAPLAPLSKLIGKGVSQIVEDIAKRRKS